MEKPYTFNHFARYTPHLKAHATRGPKIQKSSSKDIKITYKQEKYVAEIFQLQNGLNAKLRRMTLADEVNLQELKLDGIFGKKTRQACLLVLGTETVSKEQFDSLVNDL